MKKLVLVETISQHRVRYVVEVEDNIEHALDEVVCREGDVDEFKEFSQMHLGNVIVSHREISGDEYLKIFNEDNDYLSMWPEEQKNRLINVIDYTEENTNGA
jgi:hypothetical protein